MQRSKMVDDCIYDTLVRNNLNSVYDTFANNAVINKSSKGFSFERFKYHPPTLSKLTCCDISTRENILVAAGNEHKAFVWKFKGSTRGTVPGHSGKHITDIRFRQKSEVFATCSNDKTVKIWNASGTGTLRGSLVGHASPVTSVDFHPCNGGVLCSCDKSGEIKLWDVTTSNCLHTFEGANKLVRFQPQTGKLLAAVTRNTISLINHETDMVQYQLSGHAQNISSICWDSFGNYLVSVSRDMARIWSVSEGKCVRMLQSSGNKFVSCAFHPAYAGYAQIIVLGSYQCIEVWRAATGNQTWRFQAHDDFVSALATAPECNMIASASHDGRIKLWKANLL